LPAASPWASLLHFSSKDLAMNKNLTPANEKQVLALIQNDKIKGEWQAHAYLFNKNHADVTISRFHGVPVSTVKAARYYW
jgi:hypothetical protein